MGNVEEAELGVDVDVNDVLVETIKWLLKETRNGNNVSIVTVSSGK